MESLFGYIMSQLHVITTVSNPAMYGSRYKLYRDFRKRIEDSGIALYTVELATGDQEFSVTDATNPHHIQLRTVHELWYKENLLNIAIRYLPKDWKYVAWLDADILFVRPNWAAETIAQLEHHAFVQMYSHVIDLGPDYEPLRVQEGFSYRYRTKKLGDGQSNTETLGTPGYAWAARRHEFEAVGGLIDWSIMGSNDYFMALGLVGAMTPEMTRMPGSNYAEMLMGWQSKCEQHVHRDIGYVGNTLVHFWHGRRKDRGYDNRWKILVDNSFDPKKDLTRSIEGLLGLSDDKPALRDAIRRYFRARNEDDTEL
jgi:hypothetical protein